MQESDKLGLDASEQLVAHTQGLAHAFVMAEAARIKTREMGVEQQA